MKNVMIKAWEIAKAAAIQFGGSSKQYLAEALRMAWASIKEEKEMQLKGSEKQISWVKNIIAKFDEQIASAKQQKMIEYGQRIMAILNGAEILDAGWVIQYRDDFLNLNSSFARLAASQPDAKLVNRKIETFTGFVVAK